MRHRHRCSVTLEGMTAADHLTDGWFERRPAPELRSVIDRYVGYRMTRFARWDSPGVPSCYMTLIVSIGNSIDVIGQTDPTQEPRSYRCVVSGLQVERADCPRRQSGRRGHRVDATREQDAAGDAGPGDLGSVAGVERGGRRRRRRTVGASPPGADWSERLDACDDVMSRLVGDDAVEPVLERCWRTLVGSGGRISIDELADRTGFSRQHLGRRFRDEFGLSPKLAARSSGSNGRGTMLEAVPSYVSTARWPPPAGTTTRPTSTVTSPNSPA